MPPPPTESDNYKLLFAVLDQLEVKGVNWVKVAEQLGVDKVGTVQKRWSVLKKKEGLGQGATTTATTAIATATPKKRAAGANGKSGAQAKKAKTVKKKNSKAEESGEEADVPLAGEDGEAEEYGGESDH